jgi:hypothetical protein
VTATRISAKPSSVAADSKRTSVPVIPIAYVIVGGILRSTPASLLPTGWDTKMPQLTAKQIAAPRISPHTVGGQIDGRSLGRREDDVKWSHVVSDFGSRSGEPVELWWATRVWAVMDLNQRPPRCKRGALAN